MMTMLLWHQDKQKRYVHLCRKQFTPFFVWKALASIITYPSPAETEMENKQKAIEFKSNIIILISC